MQNETQNLDITILKPSKFQYALLLIVGLALVVGGVVMIDNSGMGFVPLLTLAFGLACSLLFAPMAVGRVSLTLDPVGFTLKFFNARKFYWKDFSQFDLITLPSFSLLPFGGRPQMIIWKLREGYSGPIRGNKGFPNLYAIKGEDLLERMRSYHTKYGQAGSIAAGTSEDVGVISPTVG